MPVPTYMGGGGYQNVGPLQIPVEDITIEPYLQGIAAGHALPNTATAVARGVTALGEDYRRNQLEEATIALTDAQARKANMEAQYYPEKLQAELEWRKAQAAYQNANAAWLPSKSMASVYQSMAAGNASNAQAALAPQKMAAEAAKQRLSAKKQELAERKAQSMLSRDEAITDAQLRADDFRKGMATGDPAQQHQWLDWFERNMGDMTDTAITRSGPDVNGPPTLNSDIDKTFRYDMISAAEKSPDPAVRERAARLAERWRLETERKSQVLAGQVAKPPPVVAPGSQAPVTAYDELRSGLDEQAANRGQVLAENARAAGPVPPEPGPAPAPKNWDEWFKLSINYDQNRGYEAEKARETQQFPMLNAYRYSSQGVYQSSLESLVRLLKRNNPGLSDTEAREQAKEELGRSTMQPTEAKEFFDRRSKVEDLDMGIRRMDVAFKDLFSVLKENPSIRKSAIRSGKTETLAALLEESIAKLSPKDERRNRLIQFRQEMTTFGSLQAAYKALVDLGVGVRGFDTEKEQEMYRAAFTSAGSNTLEKNLEVFTALRVKAQVLKGCFDVANTLMHRGASYQEAWGFASEYYGNNKPDTFENVGGVPRIYPNLNVQGPMEFIDQYYFGHRARVNMTPVNRTNPLRDLKGGKP